MSRDTVALIESNAFFLFALSLNLKCVTVSELEKVRKARLEQHAVTRLYTLDAISTSLPWALLLSVCLSVRPSV